MTHTDLIARLREPRPRLYVGRGLLNEAADALTAAQERIEALEEVIHNTLAAGLPEEVAQSARAALDATGKGGGDPDASQNTAKEYDND